jgi:hypothetical protein
LPLFNARGVQPYNTEPGDLSTRSASGFGDGVTYFNWGPGLIVELGERLVMQLDVDIPANTRNIAHGVTYRVGLAVKR